MRGENSTGHFAKGRCVYVPEDMSYYFVSYSQAIVKVDVSKGVPVEQTLVEEEEEEKEGQPETFEDIEYDLNGDIYSGEFRKKLLD